MLNVNPWNLLCIVLNLLILAALMKKFLYKPVLGIIEKRQNLIDEQMTQAQNCKAEAQQLKEKYESSLTLIQEEQNRILRETKAQAQQEYNRILEDAETEAKQVLCDAEQISQAKQEHAVRSAEAEIAKLASEAAAKIIGHSSGSQTDAFLYDDFLRKAGE